ncbi:MAG: hypothetical protein KGK00_05620 [Paracoccaceae bacterium]|nr:hypothetical protein [Paracoccaceae bacterium]
MQYIKFRPEGAHCENVEAIAGYLEEVLKGIRKMKLAQDLIGDDEKSAGFLISNMNDFADELSAGIEITLFDRRRIKERARALAERQRKIRKR